MCARQLLRASSPSTGCHEARDERRPDARIAVAIAQPAHLEVRRGQEVSEPPATPLELVAVEGGCRARRAGSWIRSPSHSRAASFPGVDALGEPAVVEIAGQPVARIGRCAALSPPGPETGTRTRRPRRSGSARDPGSARRARTRARPARTGAAGSASSADRGSPRSQPPDRARTARAARGAGAIWRVGTLGSPVVSTFAVSVRWTSRASTRRMPVGDAHASATARARRSEQDARSRASHARLLRGGRRAPGAAPEEACRRRARARSSSCPTARPEVARPAPNRPGIAAPSGSSTRPSRSVARPPSVKAA